MAVVFCSALFELLGAGFASGVISHFTPTTEIVASGYSANEGWLDIWQLLSNAVAFPS